MRGAFARFWSMRLSTALQIGNARMARYWMRQLGYDPAADYDALHLHAPHDLAEIIADWHDDEAGGIHVWVIARSTDGVDWQCRL